MHKKWKWFVDYVELWCYFGVPGIFFIANYLHTCANMTSCIILGFLKSRRCFYMTITSMMSINDSPIELNHICVIFFIDLLEIWNQYSKKDFKTLAKWTITIKFLSQVKLFNTVRNALFIILVFWFQFRNYCWSK